MSTNPHKVSVELTIPFHDCDPLGVAWHGRYFQYMAQARAALMKSIELDVPDVRALGLLMFISDARCRYTFPLRYDDTARVTACFTRTKPVLRVAYEVTNVTANRRSARGHTDIAITDPNGTLLTEPPEIIASRLPL